MNIIDVLQERGFIDSLTSEEMRQATSAQTKVYCGFDPTSDSLHLGNLVAIMGLAWFQRYGHTPVALVGGATGMIGDPSGKSSQRQLLDEESIAANLRGIEKNLRTILNFEQKNNSAVILNNFDWYKNFSVIDFLREVGSLFRIGPMLGKESVRLRMQSEEGMSYTEFSYQLLQGFDFLHLCQTEGVTIQLGGSDQWGNITAGTDLIRRVEGKQAFGITFPLLTKSDGQKFGKSEKGAIWLSPEKLSPYEFYQYLVRTEDADVIKLMCMLTFMKMDEIRDYETQMKEPSYIPRTAQKRLAEEVTRLVHGQDQLEKAIRVTEALAPGSDSPLNSEVLEELAKDMPSFELPGHEVLGKKLVDLLVVIGSQNSKGEARRLIEGGGVSLNNVKIHDKDAVIDQNAIIDNSLILITFGKTKKLLLRLI